MENKCIVNFQIFLILLLFMPVPHQVFFLGGLFRANNILKPFL